MKRKLLSLIMTGAMVLSLAACGAGGDAGSGAGAGSGEGTGAGSGTEAGNPVTETAGETLENCGDLTLTMWCIATESDSNRHSYEAAIADLKTAYPNITFEWEAIENEAYKTKIKAAVAADDMPDIFFTWSCAFLQDFVDAGRVWCLDDAYQAYKDELPESMLGNTTYNGKHYGVPLTMNIVGLFANMDLLKQVGYDEIPGTYDDFIACCDALKAAGIIPFGCAGKETWCVTEYVEPIIEKSIGSEAMNDIFVHGATWNNQDVADAVDKFQMLVNNGYFDPSGIALSNDEVKQNFMDGKYAFYMNGTWNCADFSKEGKPANVKVGEFPVINADKASLGMLIGGPSDTLAVAAGSEHPEVAAQYCFELGKLICHYGYLDGCGLPAWTPYGDTSSINPLTQSVAEICGNAKGYVLFGDTAMNADDARTYLDYVAMVYGCEVDGKGFIEGLTNDIR
jgi:raffinose/stachyose/melibiose transport system substrate-binding protein